ncbi:hypothetical protein HXX76_012268 [Chlamydomonas incerta]|uniref:FAS1 domain-containing protein n=1 Tax=Chlamydomonas incerta TaxID=51695 RepID=A0A835VTV6_CHLIN|nr:hypothetical protein HXX76_012268 [Chlamydomonas incerta]|eukprot:KAG2427615.1 hypothetical protein HXX76_012268 [Chlamydomonas incerta]
MLDCGKRCGTLQKLPRTVFLPVNVAWQKYFTYTGTTLAELTSKKSRKALTALMRYHVLAQVVTSSRVPLSAEVTSSSTGGSSSGSSSGSSGGGEEVETLQGGSITIARRPNTSTIRVAGSRNQAVVLHADISLGTPVVHLVSDVLLLEVASPPPSELPSPMPSPSPPPPSPSPSPAPSPSYASPTPSPGSGSGSGSPKPLSRPGTPITGSTIFNLTWDRNVDMDLIVVTSWPETDSPDTMTMFYGYTGPEALIGGGAMSASMTTGSGALTGFYSRTAGSWEALSWPNPLKPAPAVYTICSFFYNLEWAPGTVINADNPVTPAFSVITGADQNAGAGRGTAGSSSSSSSGSSAGEVLVGTLGKPLWKPGEFSFTLLPRNCTPECAWYLGQVCVDGAGKVRVVSGAERC